MKNRFEFFLRFLPDWVFKQPLKEDRGERCLPFRVLFSILPGAAAAVSIRQSERGRIVFRSLIAVRLSE